MDFEKKLKKMSDLVVRNENKPIVAEILKIFEKNELTISKSIAILEQTKKVLPKIVTLNKN